MKYLPLFIALLFLAMMLSCGNKNNSSNQPKPDNKRYDQTEHEKKSNWVGNGGIAKLDSFVKEEVPLLIGSDSIFYKKNDIAQDWTAVRLDLERKTVLDGRLNFQHKFFVASKDTIICYRMTYLGAVTSKEGELHFVDGNMSNNINYRAYSWLFIGDKAGKKIGQYNTGTRMQHPQRFLKDGNIIFQDTTDNCYLRTWINFRDSIPNEIYILCTFENGGDLYAFERP